ncbi:MAG: hypothetical protein GY822_02055, partial [Deltaproteobacteria bacterium]|nr:hypothetical protein [Deltaproteobacteria bacterium]
PVEEKIADADKDQKKRVKKLKAEIAEVPARFTTSEREQAAEAERKFEQDKAKKPKIERNYRMAYCATVSLHDAEGKALHTIKYGRMGPSPDQAEYVTKSDVKTLMRQLMVDVATLRKGRPLRVVLLADGASELWNLFAYYLNEKTLGVRPSMLVDAWHALEYVAAAARFLEALKRVWPGAYRRWKRMILEDKDGIESVHAELKEAGLENARDANGDRPVGDAIRYIGN